LNRERRAGVEKGMSVKTVIDSSPHRTRQRLALRAAGAGLLIATGAIHLDLYLTGYRTIPTIGWLFLLQVIAAFGLALAVGLLGSRIAAALGALFALATLGGYLLTIWFGLFGFREVRTTAGIVAGVIEVAAFAVLAALALAGLALAPAPQHAHHGPSRARARDGLPGALAAAGGVSVLALVLLGVAVAGAATAPGAPAPSSSSASGQVLKTIQIKGVTVLTNSKGMTLYWFAPDTPTKSACYGSCAAYWPPVYGAQKAGPGVTGTLGTIRRSDGTIQATYDGHPLYTYIADNAPGQATGNNINLNGGLWHEVLASSG
jgi:predicted lipoprotein with Yx(FWY)xxD motif